MCDVMEAGDKIAGWESQAVTFAWNKGVLWNYGGRSSNMKGFVKDVNTIYFLFTTALLPP